MYIGLLVHGAGKFAMTAAVVYRAACSFGLRMRSWVFLLNTHAVCMYYAAFSAELVQAPAAATVDYIGIRLNQVQALLVGTACCSI